MPIFDKHSWKPNLLKTTSEINDYLKQNRIKNKPVKMIHTIGVAKNLCNENYIYDVRDTLLKSGVPYQDMSADKYPYWDDIQIPIAVTVCEPIVSYDLCCISTALPSVCISLMKITFTTPRQTIVCTASDPTTRETNRFFDATLSY